MPPLVKRIELTGDPGASYEVTVQDQATGSWRRHACVLLVCVLIW
jgi:hypothetical protein